MKLVTYHSNSSNGIGGVEALVRSLQLLAYDHDATVFELYLKEGTGRVFESPAPVTKISCGYKFGGSRWYNRFVRAFFLRKSLKHIGLGMGDCIVLFDPKQVALLPIKVRRRSKVILVQVNRVDMLFKSVFSRASIFFLGKYVDLVAVYTEADDRELRERYKCFADKIRVIPRACKLECGKKRPVFGKRLVTVARIDEAQKNFRGMLAIFKMLSSEYSLDIYGDGSEDEVHKLKEIIKDVHGVNYLGATSDVANALQKNSVFIMTSHYEGFGQTLIEARSQGLPVIVYNTFKAASWVVKDNCTGFLVDYQDADSFASKIQILTSDKKLYESFVDNSFRFSAETNREKVDSLWVDALGLGGYV